jgi:hypothetical protein
MRPWAYELRFGKACGTNWLASYDTSKPRKRKRIRLGLGYAVVENGHAVFC